MVTWAFAAPWFQRRIPAGVTITGCMWTWAILDAANECLGHFDDRPPGERWCDALFHLLDLAAFATELGSADHSRDH